MALQVNFTGFKQQVLWKQRPFIPKIYAGAADEPPPGFNTVSIFLEATDRSSLNWKHELDMALKYTQKGFLILWEIHLGLLEGSLEDETRFLTLQLGLHHFNETIWPDFQEYTLGVSIDRGYLDVQQIRHVMDYLKLLIVPLPQETSCFLFFDTTLIKDAPTYFRFINQKMFGYVYPVLKGHFAEKYPFAFPALAWQHSYSALGFCSTSSQKTLQQQRISYALCLPEKDTLMHEMRQVLNFLEGIPFRVIPESLLTQEWDGIEKLILFPQGLSARGKRKVCGFVAAGGETINYPDDAALLQPPEISPPSFPVFLP